MLTFSLFCLAVSLGPAACLHACLSLRRAACYKQLSNFDMVISDCTAVLEVRVRP